MATRYLKFQSRLPVYIRTGRCWLGTSAEGCVIQLLMLVMIISCPQKLLWYKVRNTQGKPFLLPLFDKLST